MCELPTDYPVTFHTNMKGGTLTYSSCRIADSEYSLVTAGRECIRITTKDQCEKAAKSLGMDDVEASTVEGKFQETNPPFCFYKQDELHRHRLRFNWNGAGMGNCSTVRNCLCLTKEGKYSSKMSRLKENYQNKQI